jgi:ABC-2 type transport system permease protein
MHNIFTIASAEILSLFREKTIYFITGVFVFMAAMSSFIGWSTFITADAVYKASVLYLHAHGISNVPMNPLQSVPALASFTNLIVYILLIGALLAVIIGHRSMMRERRAGILQVIFSRPVTKQSMIAGKVLGISMVLLSVMLLTAFISIVSSYFLPLQHLNARDVIHLLSFFLLSFFYMVFFAMVGLLFSIVAKSESLALFIPICIWVGMTFVLPEVATGLTPTALLNPVTILQLPALEGFFQTTQSILSPISLSWHYTSISGELLGSAFWASHPLRAVFADHVTEMATLLIVTALLITLSYKSLQNFNSRADFINE